MSNNLPKRYSDEDRAKIMEVLCQFSSSEKGAKACSALLADDGIEVPPATLRNWQLTKRDELKAILEAGTRNIMAIPISHAGYRMAKLQEILEDESISNKDKLAAMRAAREEQALMTGNKAAFSPEDYMKLPAVLRAELEKRAGNAIDAEFSIVDPHKVVKKEEALLEAALIPLPKGEEHPGNKKKPVEPPEKVETSEDDFLELGK